MYVTVMMALAEAFSPQGSVLAAVMIVLFYGLLPLAIVLYIAGTPQRKRRLRQKQMAEQAVQAETQAPKVLPGPERAAADPPQQS
ncbi:hypothetical protein D8I35_04390 [Corticibacter populi]|uniref:Uncharacterized protein n=2 Tax=Corticibacter populi TaxID=1550736 RepID=A0A3M6QZH1_9BURK|nr:hypothetical protein D8I35_04390 [Corticibacter populi]